jgi:signal transduction histidine kinase/CheY-like chemotaxis protein
MNDEYSPRPGTPRVSIWLTPFLLALALVAISRYNYLLFHLLAEMFAIGVALLAAVVAWNSFPFSRNHFLVYLGIGYFWIAGLDLLHTLGYRGMGLLAVDEANVATQLWLAARYLEALLLLSAPWFLNHPLHRRLAGGAFGLTASLLAALILSGHFPDAYLAGSGLTPFKVASEYLIVALLGAALAWLWQRRALLDPLVFRQLAAAMTLTMCAELAFTFYVSVYGLSNLLGHLFKLASFWLVFQAIVETTLRAPYRMLDHSLRREMEERRQAELALRESESRYRTLFREAPQGVVLCSGAGETLEANPAAVRLLGGRPAPGTGLLRPPRWHCQREDESEVPPAELPGMVALRTGQAVRNMVLRITSPLHPEPTWLSVDAVPLPDERGGPPRGVLVGLTDITQARRMQQGLIHAHRLQVAGQFAAGVAHDFNNMLAKIVGFAELLQLPQTDPAARADHLAQILAAASEARDLVRQLLLYSRGDATRGASLQPLAPLVEQDLEFLAPMLPRNIDLATRLVDEARVYIEPGHLRELLVNLCLNARDAMPGGGTLTVGCDRVTLEDARCLICQHPLRGDWVRLWVQDTGSGIPAELREIIFQPFFTTKSVARGSGMGLAVVQGLVQSYRGHILLHTPGGRGTRFEVLLPPPVARIGPATRNPHDQFLAGRWVLVVESEIGARLSLTATLTAFGARVTAYDEPESALARLLGTPDSFDLLVVDQTLAGMSGIALVRRLRARRPDIPVLMYQDEQTPVADHERSGLGIAGMIDKPADPERLAATVASVLGLNRPGHGPDALAAETGPPAAAAR